MRWPKEWPGVRSVMDWNRPAADAVFEIVETWSDGIELRPVDAQTAGCHAIYTSATDMRVQPLTPFAAELLAAARGTR